MNYKNYLFLLLLLLPAWCAIAQKPFAEGTIVYKVNLQAGDQKAFTGVYTFVIKGGQIRKELKLDNGYQDVLIIDCGAGKAYSLQNRNDKKFVIQLDINDIARKQQRFTGYTIKNEVNDNKHFAGYASWKGNINYNDGSSAEIFYTKEWRPSQAITFERFPNAQFMPAYFSYKDENEMAMQFELDKIEPGPVENAVFRIPPDYQVISNSEYKQLSK